MLLLILKLNVPLLFIYQSACAPAFRYRPPKYINVAPDNTDITAPIQPKGATHPWLPLYLAHSSIYPIYSLSISTKQFGNLKAIVLIFIFPP